MATSHRFEARIKVLPDVMTSICEPLIEVLEATDKLPTKAVKVFFKFPPLIPRLEKNLGCFPTCFLDSLMLQLLAKVYYG